MKCFDVDDVKTQEQYTKFIEYMLSYSEYFSFIYFRYSENEKMKKSAREIHDALKKFKVKSCFTNEWPGTISFDTTNFYKFVVYRSDVSVKEILCRYHRLFDWDYPQAPMDLCFYKNGYCCFSVTAHECDATLYTDDNQLIFDLQQIGMKFKYLYDTDQIFHLKLS